MGRSAGIVVILLTLAPDSSQSGFADAMMRSLAALKDLLAQPTGEAQVSVGTGWPSVMAAMNAENSSPCVFMRNLE